MMMTMTETKISGNYREGNEALHAADAAILNQHVEPAIAPVGRVDDEHGLQHHTHQEPHPVDPATRTAAPSSRTGPKTGAPSPARSPPST